MVKQLHLKILIKDLESKLQSETDPSKREDLEKALKAMKLVINIDNNKNPLV